MLYNSDLLQNFLERGYIYQCTNQVSLDDNARAKSIAGYIGFDCTAKSLHVGSLVQIMMLRKLQQYGHKPIIIMGGGTTKIGDPTGKDQARLVLSDAQIAENKDGIKKVFEKFVRFGDGKTDAVMVDNAQWLDEIKYIDFLKNVGKYFSINRMLTFDSVKLRLEREQSLSFLEFNYMLLQAYDFVELYDRYGCILQMGGSDQWGNIVSGVELGRKMRDVEFYGLTSELITTSSGAKMGKSANGAVWLNEDMLDTYDYWQFWRNTSDKDVGKFLRLFTELDISEIKKLELLQGSELNEAKIILANEATRMCHNIDAATNAYKTAVQTFAGGVGADLPVYEVSSDVIRNGLSLYQILHMSGLSSSLSEAKRLIKGRGAKINNQIIEDEYCIVDEKLFIDGAFKLSSGQKKHIIIKIR